MKLFLLGCAAGVLVLLLALYLFRTPGIVEGPPYELPVLGRVTLDLLPSPDRLFVFAPAAEKTLAVVEIGEFGSKVSTFSLPDGKPCGDGLLLVGNVLPGRNEIAWYSDDEAHTSGKLFVFRDLANARELQYPPSDKPDLTMPGGLETVRPDYTRYTGNHWWVLYGEQEIFLIERATLKVVTLPAIYGDESRIAISNDIAVLTEHEREGPFAKTTLLAAPSYFAIVKSTQDRPEWRKLSTTSGKKNPQLAAWMPLDGGLLSTLEYSDSEVLSSVFYSVSAKGELKAEHSSELLAYVVPDGEDNLVCYLEETYKGFFRRDPFRCLRYYEYFSFSGAMHLVATADDDSRNSRRAFTTQAAGLDKRIVTASYSGADSRLELIEGGIARPIPIPGVAKAWYHQVSDGRLYIFNQPEGDNDKKMEIVIVKLDDGFYPQLYNLGEQYVR